VHAPISDLVTRGGMDEFQQEALRRLDRIERKVNEVVSVVLLASSALCAFGAGSLTADAARQLLGKDVADTAAVTVGATAFFVSWSYLHKKVFEGR
jgi:hypothetical protein